MRAEADPRRREDGSAARGRHSSHGPGRRTDGPSPDRRRGGLHSERTVTNPAPRTHGRSAHRDAGRSMSGSSGRASDRVGRGFSGRHDGRGPGGTAGDKRRALEELFRLLQRGTSIDPHERIRLELEPEGLSMRAMDLVTPIGKGQRCLIVSPPKAGKTMLLMDVARSVEKNHPEISVYALLVDERPEEVTHFRRGVKAQVYAASSDLSASEHVDRAEEAMTDILEHVVAGEDVLLLLDSITRLARAYNNVLEGTGRTLTGGLDAATMQAPRQVFGAARKIEEGGSLTILGTALIDTGSRMDEVIFQEFKGTGNTELVLSRELFEKRIFPCIDIGKSGSRKEEKLVPPALLPRLHMLRRALAGRKTEEAMTGLLGLLQKYRTNEELLQSLA